jgi:cysteine-rich repeat protein
MRLHLLLLALLISCSSNEAPSTSKPLCTPGNNVFCRCADPNSEGTKRCSDDGMSFSECECGDIVDTGTEEDTDIPPEDTMTMMETSTGGEDKCPGKTVAVDPGKEVVIDSDTTSAANDSTGTGACAVAAGNDHVYAVIPTGTGKLAIKLAGTAPLDPTLVVRDGCAMGAQLACGETTGVAGTEVANINVVTGKTYYVWADGKAGTAGAYKLSLTLTTGTFCGDGTPDMGEGCDDGNKTAGDGCENDCRPTGDVMASDKCPGVSAHVWPGKTLTWSGSTTDANVSYGEAGTCAGFGNSAPDRVYALVAHATGTMTVEVDAMYNVGFYVRKAPCETGMQLACANSVGASTIPQTEKTTFPVTNGETYYLIVDGALTSKGTFTVKASVL